VIVRTVLDWFAVRAVDMVTEVSCSGKGLRISILLDKALPDDAVLRMQFLLGDDRTRCRLNLERFKAGISDWNVLFRRKIVVKDKRTRNPEWWGPVHRQHHKEAMHRFYHPEEVVVKDRED